MENYTEEQKLTIYKSAEGLLKMSYAFRDINDEIGKDAAILADKTLKLLEEAAEPSFEKECIFA